VEKHLPRNEKKTPVRISYLSRKTLKTRVKSLEQGEETLNKGGWGLDTVTSYCSKDLGSLIPGKSRAPGY